jgi:hypothetical protein
MKLFFAMMLMLVTSLAFGQDMPSEALPPVWIGDVLVWLKSVPHVGPILVEVLKWISVLGTIFTVVATAATAILKVPEIAARIAGADAFADKLKKLHDKIMPWLRYLSIYNQQKIAPKK